MPGIDPPIHWHPIGVGCLALLVVGCTFRYSEPSPTSIERPGPGTILGEVPPGSPVSEEPVQLPGQQRERSDTETVRSELYLFAQAQTRYECPVFLGNAVPPRSYVRAAGIVDCET